MGLIADIDMPTHVEIVLDDIAGPTAKINMTCEEAHDLAVDLLILVAQARANCDDRALTTGRADPLSTVVQARRRTPR